MKQPRSSSSEPTDLAELVWELMSGFVHGHDPADELRQTLGLGRGAGRVKALMGLAAGPLSLAELGQAIGTDASYTTIIVNELQAAGLLSRTADARDGRRKTVELTADGRAAMRKAQAIITRPPSSLRDLPSADLLRLRDILGQISQPSLSTFITTVGGCDRAGTTALGEEPKFFPARTTGPPARA